MNNLIKVGEKEYMTSKEIAEGQEKSIKLLCAILEI